MLNFDEVNIEIIYSYIQTLSGFTYKTVEQHICSLRAFFRFLYNKGVITEDFADEREAARPAWLEFSFDDIRYLIVPTIQARIELIKEILALPSDGFSSSESENIGKSVLISKILVLDEIRKDW